MSVFEWILVSPNGQGHAYIEAVVTNFLMTAFIIMSENAPSYITLYYYGTRHKKRYDNRKPTVKS